VPEPSHGAVPEGAADEASAALAVRAMFDAIAPKYDLLNHVLSFNIDRLWWWSTARKFRSILRRPEAAILDICCGTGDMTMALVRHRPAGARPILAADFAHQMLVRGARKFAGHASQLPVTLPASKPVSPPISPQASAPLKSASPPAAIALEADAMRLPVRSRSLNLITTAFGFRNLRNYRDGLAEFHRALAPGGQLGILDFSEPGGLIGKLYAFYFRRVLPAIGSRISGVAGPYAYLPSSVERFPAPAQMLELMRSVGFENVSWTPYSFGIAGLYRASRARTGARP
jgi:demethylmenaquinone methyltransferase/2-methoxy-6-polyprenyl-1,4-benzoquinol methylase